MHIIMLLSTCARRRQRRFSSAIRPHRKNFFLYFWSSYSRKSISSFFLLFKLFIVDFFDVLKIATQIHTKNIFFAKLSFSHFAFKISKNFIHNFFLIWHIYFLNNLFQQIPWFFFLRLFLGFFFCMTTSERLEIMYDQYHDRRNTEVRFSKNEKHSVAWESERVCCVFAGEILRLHSYAW